MITDFLTGLAILAAFITGGEAPQPELTFGAFGDPFLSLQVGTNPTSGDCLQTNGTDSTWDPCPAGGGGGSFPFSATTNYGQVVYATSTPTLWFQSGVFASSTSRFVHASTTAFNATFGSTTYSTSTALTATTGFFTNVFIGVDTIAEYIADTAGAMFTGNTETDITITYDDADNTIDAVVDTLPNLTGTLDVDSGGTGVATFSSSQLLYGNGTAALTSVATSSLAVGASISSSGTLFAQVGGTASTLSLNMGNANTWTALQTFANASSTLFSSSYASSTLLMVGNSTTTNATSTTLSVSGQVDFDTYTSAILLTGATGILAEYAGTNCTNQVIEDLSALGAASCVSINNGYWNGTDLSVANGGTGLSTFGGTNHVLYTTAADTISSEAAYTYSPTADLLTIVNASTTRIGASTYMEIPDGAAPGINFPAMIALDSTVNQFIFATSTAYPAVVQPWHTTGFSYASSTAWTGTTTISLAPATDALNFVDVQCKTNAGTLNVSLNDGTNRANLLNASTTVGVFKFNANQTFTLGEEILIDIGTPASSPTRIGCRFKYSYDPR